MLTALLVCGCGSNDAPLPPLPPLELAGLDADVAADIRASEAAVVAQPKGVAENTQLARLLHSYGQHAWAAICYARARQLDPEDFELAYLHADVLMELGDSEGAVAALRQVREMRRDYVPATLRLAGLLLDSGAGEQARVLYEDVLGQQPDNPQALLGMAGLTTTTDDAVILLERAADPRRPFGRAHYALAGAYRRQGQSDAADEQLVYFQRFKGREPALADPLLEEVAALNRSRNGLMARAILLLGRGNSAAAATSFEAVLRKDPEHMAAYTYLVIAYGNLGKSAQARERYETAVALGNTPVQLHGNMGVLELKQKRYHVAQELFNKALAIDAEYALGHFYLGATLEMRGQPVEALEHYKRAVDIDPENRQAGHYLANMHRKLGNHADAIAQFERIIAIEDAQTPMYLKDMATAYRRHDEPAMALAALDRASRLAEDYGLTDLQPVLDEERTRLRRIVADQ